MARLLDEKKLLGLLKLIGRCTVSCIFVFLTQFSLSLVPRFFSTTPFLLQLALSALLLLVVLGFCRRCRRHLGLYSSASAFVFFNILFIWSFYVFVVRKAVSRLMDGLFNSEVVMMIIALIRLCSFNSFFNACTYLICLNFECKEILIDFCYCKLYYSIVSYTIMNALDVSIQSRDPGLVAHETPSSDMLFRSSSFGVDSLDENSLSLRRIRYCKSCKAYIRGFDHHCPAFGNCIGQNNYALFMVLLVGFLTTEASYLMCSAQFVRKSRNFGQNWLEINLVGNLAISTMLFSILQVLWQGVFLMWHVYCICFNVRTDEWINWRKYPEFQVVYSEPGESFTRVMFRNPYDKGIPQNVKDFLALRG